MKRSVLAAFSLLCVPLSALVPRAGAQSSFTLEQVMSAPFPSELTAAKSGNRVAWVFDQEGRRNIWVAEGPEFQARQLTKYAAWIFPPTETLSPTCAEGRRIRPGRCRIPPAIRRERSRLCGRFLGQEANRSASTRGAHRKSLRRE